MSEPRECLEIRTKQKVSESTTWLTPQSNHTYGHLINIILWSFSSYQSYLTWLENSSGSKYNVRVHCCPGEFCEDVLAGGVMKHAGEMQRRRQSVFIAELCWSHPMELFRLREVHFRGDQNTWDVAFHVMLLRKRQNEDLRKRNLSFICPAERKSENELFNSPNEIQISSFQDMNVNKVLLLLLVHCWVLSRLFTFWLCCFFVGRIKQKNLMTGWEEPMNFRRGSK